ncbi:uncharacterized protein GGS25DRAFT_384231 [Hypoxylon fragiforme]|uniref:uncharacterized protein n=1 Tax=Hypoxylon fragiforme TaxID=63214 RepID=UPI0020C6C198|nr:uncharacterized protein GGS25DRAFT_384231 [Hypoxylon fragiforme]KAI2606310.1 hypothetical protein GGS25DRAFT_384231 [Hypoxylon fragiforme]
MNWTEGNLSRHSRGRQRNELLAKQKQHFAKVRNSLSRGGVKQSPVSISFLGARRSGSSGRRDGSNGISHISPSSPLLTEKRKRSQSSRNDLKEQTSIREKRRRLLDMTDWVGLNLQQPTDIVFPRKIPALDGQKWGKADRVRAHMAQKRHETADLARLETAQEARNHPLRIQIGSQEIDPSDSTAFQPVTKRYSLAPHPLSSSSHKRSDQISSPEPSHARHLYVASVKKQASGVPRNERGGVARERRRMPRKAPVEPISMEEPTHVVYSSSMIHEPAPRRANEFPVLKWSPPASEDWGSMKVDIERPARPFPPSGEADRELWKGWAVDLSDDISLNVPTTPRIAAESSSPKAGSLPSDLQIRYPVYDASSELATSTSCQLLESAKCEQENVLTTIDDGTRPSPGYKLAHEDSQVRVTDENEIWMKFAFDGDIDELEADMFREAAHQAAVELRPSETSTDGVNTIKMTTTCETDPLNFLDTRQTDATFSSTSSESHIATHGTVVSEPTSSNIATTGSTNVAEPESRFRFAQPKPFVGKLADPSVHVQGPPLRPKDAKKRRGRSKKKAVDGRTDIRRLPDFDGDPIEEFEE